MQGDARVEDTGRVTVQADHLPGLPSSWTLEGVGLAEVREASHRLLRLSQLLGGSCDVAWMVSRQPDLLTADFNLIIRRLLQMRAMASSSDTDVDVLDVVSKQPSLLINDKDWLSFHQQGDTSSSAQQEYSDEDRRPGDMLRSWEAGVVSDSQKEWMEKYLELKSYKDETGDPHVGFGREFDSPSLSRWTAKQRSDFKRGEISDQRRDFLESLGFEWDDSDAEFMRWLVELTRFKISHGHSNPNPLSAGNDHYLINWCGLQRIALRCKVLSQRRERLLNDLAFDWTGADPLS